MGRFIVLDAGPLGIASKKPNKPDAHACIQWIVDLEAAGAEIIVPEIADYEVRRELILHGKVAGLQRLDGMLRRFTYLPLSMLAMRKAAEWWAHVRKMGQPTAGPHDLDADAILAGQAFTVGRQPGDIVTIATTNVRHLSRFPGISADLWSNIT